MLIFYYGLLFLETLSISDGVATFILIALIDFFIGKTIWQDYKPFITWRKKKYKQLIKLKKQAKKSFLKKWEKASLLKRAYIIVAGVVGFALLILFVHLYLEVLWISWDDIGGDDKIRNLAIAFIGTITGIGALFGVYLAILRSEENTRQNKIANDQNKIANRQAITAEQGLITDRINKAVESLGRNDDGKRLIQVRVGALYALERIAQDSIRDHVRIIKILCAYIRNTSSNDTESDTKGIIRDDIRTIQIIIRGRNEWSKYNTRLEMETADTTMFDFYNCHLEGAELHTANLSHANFHKANLKNAWFEYADLSYARLENAILDGAQFTKAKTNMAYAFNLNLLKCNTLTQEQLNVMYCGLSVEIPKKLTRPLHWPTDKLSYIDFMETYYKWRRTQQ